MKVNPGIDGEDLAGDAVTLAKCDHLPADVIGACGSLEHRAPLGHLNDRLRQPPGHASPFDQSRRDAVHGDAGREGHREATREVNEGGLAAAIILVGHKAGETMVVLGPSGCGKTTTLRLIAGLEAPDRGGRVLFGEVDVTGLPIERRNVGMVFQSYALFPNMTVGENVAYGLRVRRLAAAAQRERVEEMFAMMQIGELRDRRVDQLS
jgi:ABC-type proline/glycine betaine transport system ATPase subunit